MGCGWTKPIGDSCFAAKVIDALVEVRGDTVKPTSIIPRSLLYSEMGAQPCTSIAPVLSNEEDFLLYDGVQGAGVAHASGIVSTELMQLRSMYHVFFLHSHNERTERWREQQQSA